MDFTTWDTHETQIVLGGGNIFNVLKIPSVVMSSSLTGKVKSNEGKGEEKQMNPREMCRPCNEFADLKWVKREYMQLFYEVSVFCSTCA